MLLTPAASFWVVPATALPRVLVVEPSTVPSAWVPPDTACRPVTTWPAPLTVLPRVPPTPEVIVLTGPAGLVAGLPTLPGAGCPPLVPARRRRQRPGPGVAVPALLAAAGAAAVLPGLGHAFP